MVDIPGTAPVTPGGMNFAWQGQSCGSTSRVFLHESIHDQVLEEVVKTVSSLRIDNPLNQDAQMGPINNKDQYEKVKYYIEAGKEDGAILMTGGHGVVVFTHTAGPRSSCHLSRATADPRAGHGGAAHRRSPGRQR